MYPETVKAADQWLDNSAGRSSPFAATMRLADGSGYARSSGWCPGMASEKPQASEAHADRTAAHAHASSSALDSGMRFSHECLKLYMSRGAGLLCSNPRCIPAAWMTRSTWPHLECWVSRDLKREFLMQKAGMSATRRAALQCPEQRGGPGGGRSRWELTACCRAPPSPQHQQRYACNQHSASHSCADGLILQAHDITRQSIGQISFRPAQ